MRVCKDAESTVEKCHDLASLFSSSRALATFDQSTSVMYVYCSFSVSPHQNANPTRYRPSFYSPMYALPENTPWQVLGEYSFKEKMGKNVRVVLVK